MIERIKIDRETQHAELFASVNRERYLLSVTYSATGGSVVNVMEKRSDHEGNLYWHKLNGIPPDDPVTRRAVAAVVFEAAGAIDELRQRDVLPGATALLREAIKVMEEIGGGGDPRYRNRDRVLRCRRLVADIKRYLGYLAFDEPVRSSLGQPPADAEDDPEPEGR